MNDIGANIQFPLSFVFADQLESFAREEAALINPLSNPMGVCLLITCERVM
jgi:hypothetical protein